MKPDCRRVGKVIATRCLDCRSPPECQFAMHTFQSHPCRGYICNSGLRGRPLAPEQNVGQRGRSTNVRRAHNGLLASAVVSKGRRRTNTALATLNSQVIPRLVGRVEWRREQFSPPDSNVSALSSFMANGRQTVPSFPPPTLKFRPAGFPASGFKRAVNSDLRGSRRLYAATVEISPCAFDSVVRLAPGGTHGF